MKCFLSLVALVCVIGIQSAEAGGRNRVRYSSSWKSQSTCVNGQCSQSQSVSTSSRTVIKAPGISKVVSVSKSEKDRKSVV